jgi:hypothetical protein
VVAMMDVNIDPKFQLLIPALQPEERRLLEESIAFRPWHQKTNNQLTRMEDEERCRTGHTTY